MVVDSNNNSFGKETRFLPLDSSSNSSRRSSSSSRSRSRRSSSSSSGSSIWISDNNIFY